MKVHILVDAETYDSQTRDDAVTSLEHTLPYMFDNVIVLSNVTDDDDPAILDWEMIGQMVRALIPGAAFETDGSGQVVVYTNHDDTGLPIS